MAADFEDRIYVIDTVDEKVLRVFTNKTGKHRTWIRIKDYATACQIKSGHAVVVSKVFWTAR